MSFLPPDDLYLLFKFPPSPTILLFSGERVQKEMDTSRPKGERWAGVNCVSQTAMPLWGEGLVWTNNRVSSAHTGNGDVLAVE